MHDVTGPFKALNAEDIDQEVSDMWRTMYKLTKTFNDQPGPRRIAESIKAKIDKFKLHLPVLHTICNPGIRDRHWAAVSYGRLCHLVDVWL
jgi:dynein heavy chain